MRSDTRKNTGNMTRAEKNIIGTITGAMISGTISVAMISGTMTGQ
jgi:hypothetical protein